MVKHQREEDGLRALARIFTGSKSESKRKRWSLGRSSRRSSFSSEPELRETLKPSPSFKERRNLRRWALAYFSNQSNIFVRVGCGLMLCCRLSACQQLWSVHAS